MSSKTRELSLHGHIYIKCHCLIKPLQLVFPSVCISLHTSKGEYWYWYHLNAELNVQRRKNISKECYSSSSLNMNTVFTSLKSPKTELLSCFNKMFSPQDIPLHDIKKYIYYVCVCDTFYLQGSTNTYLLNLSLFYAVFVNQLSLMLFITLSFFCSLLIFCT